MKKYNYKYCVYRNNCCDGVYYLKAFDRLIDALNYKVYLESFSGCCDVVKKRFLNNSDKPVNYSICGNYRYSKYDLYI
jgi:hypothetical protein